jgi:hypothetical protein
VKRFVYSMNSLPKDDMWSLIGEPDLEEGEEVLLYSCSECNRDVLSEDRYVDTDTGRTLCFECIMN